MDRKSSKSVGAVGVGADTRARGVANGGHNATVSLPTVSVERRIRMLRTAMESEIAAALEDPEVVEVLLNPDGTVCTYPKAKCGWTC